MNYATHCKVYEISVSLVIHVTLSIMQQLYWDQVRWQWHRLFAKQKFIRTFFLFCFCLTTEMITSEKRNGQQFIKPVTTIPNVIELSYYANSLVSHFVLDAIIISTATKLSQANEKQHPNTVSAVCSVQCAFVHIKL